MTARTKEVAVLTRRQVETVLVDIMGWEHEDVASFWKVTKRLGLRVEPEVMYTDRPERIGTLAAEVPFRAKPSHQTQRPIKKYIQTRA
jgi:hypothetical protein